jgi:hypothetical protein
MTGGRIEMLTPTVAKRRFHLVAVAAPIKPLLEHLVQTAAKPLGTDF